MVPLKTSGPLQFNISRWCDLICCEDDRKEILEKIKGVDALFWTARCNIDAELLDAAGTQMKIVGAMSSGLNHIDLPELKKRGIKLGSTSAISEAVADVAILLALAASRRLTEGRWQIERGTWTENKDLQWMLGLDITGSTIGIIGLGSIGQAIVKRSKGFQIGKVLYTGHREKPEGRELNAEFVDLDTLTKESDFIFVSAPLTKETVLMCNEDFFSKMKNTGIFINVSRDDLVDHTALVKALKENRIFAAGLDAMTPEPLPTDHELLKLPNVDLYVIFVSALLFSSAKGHTFNMTHRPKIYMSAATIPKKGFDLLSDVCDLIIGNDNKEDILKKVKGVDALFWATHVRLDKDILDAAGDQLKVVGTMSAGYNHIATDELKQRGIKLGNTPGVLNNAVAETAVFLALGASKRLTEGRWHIERGTWSDKTDNQWMLGQDISESAIGIIGFGGIGQAIAKRLKGFDVARIMYTGHGEKPEGKELGAEFVSQDTLTKESDYIFISAPLTKETEKMCNDTFFSKMKKTAIFINVSRGGLVDQPALVQALKEGKIFAAGLDVMTPEPLPPNDELLKLPNVVLLPHLGSATNKTRSAMAELTALNILKGLGGERMLTPVTL